MSVPAPVITTFIVTQNTIDMRSRVIIIYDAHIPMRAPDALLRDEAAKMINIVIHNLTSNVRARDG